MKKIKLYVTDMAPNGTQNLLICDAETFEVLECIEEACFGAPFKYRDDFGDMIGIDECGCIMDASEEDIENNYLTLISPVTINQVMSHIAGNPFKSHDETLQDISLAILKARKAV